MELNLRQGFELSEQERSQRTLLFRSLFFVQVIGMAIFAVLGSAGQPSLAGLVLVNVPCAVVVALLFVGRGLVQRGSYSTGVALTLVVMTIALIYFTVFYGVRSPIIFISIWPIMVSSILFGPTAGFLFATVLALSLYAVTAVELTQVFQVPLLEPEAVYPRSWHHSSDSTVITGVFVDSTTTAVVYYLAAYLSWLTSSSLQQAVERAQGMIGELQGVTEHNATVASKINTASARLSTWLREQQQGAWAQSEAVQKIAENVRHLLESSLEISRRSGAVTETAATSLANDEQIVESIQTLSSHSKRIGELLAVMKDIANKSDVLALNAALEGVKAGEKGEGFVIVAARIQVMAEDVLGSLSHIKSIVDDIRTASEEAITSTRKGTELTEHTADLTQQISAITTSQREGTERVSRAIREIEEVAQQTVVATTEVLQAMSGLVELSKEIRGLTGDEDSPFFSVIDDELVASSELEHADEGDVEDD